MNFFFILDLFLIFFFSLWLYDLPKPLALLPSVPQTKDKSKLQIQTVTHLNRETHRKMHENHLGLSWKVFWYRDDEQPCRGPKTDKRAGKTEALPVKEMFFSNNKETFTTIKELSPYNIVLCILVYRFKWPSVRSYKSSGKNTHQVFMKLLAFSLKVLQKSPH